MKQDERSGCGSQAGPGARKRMKGMALGRISKALAVSMALGLGMTACSRDYTVAYVYATSATRTTQGEINGYAVDYQSGALTQLTDSPLMSGGSNPVALVASPSGLNLYVVNHDTSTVVAFDIGTDGKLYPAQTTNVVQGSGLIGSFPTAVAIDPAGKYLYVTFTYQNGFTTATPGPGGLAIFPINTDGTLASPVMDLATATSTASPYIPVGFNPVGVVASAYNNVVYVLEQDTALTNGVLSDQGTVLAFTVTPASAPATPTVQAISGPIAVTGPTGTPLTGLGGLALTGFKAGTRPAAIAESPSARYVYVTDELTNTVIGYLVTTGTTTGATPMSVTGALQPNSSAPFPTGNFPEGVTVDPRGAFVYVANFSDSTVSSFAIDQATGALSSVASMSGSGVSTGPTCVTIEPALGIYLFTSNNTDNSVSGEQLSPNTGALTGVQGTPYPAQPLPTCIVAVANGAHASELVTNQ